MAYGRRRGYSSYRYRRTPSRSYGGRRSYRSYGRRYGGTAYRARTYGRGRYRVGGRRW